MNIQLFGMGPTLVCVALVSVGCVHSALSSWEGMGKVELNYLLKNIQFLGQAMPICNVHAEVPWEWVPKCGKAGQRDTSECSQEPHTHGTEGLASAQRLHPHGMPVPYFRRTRPSRDA